MAGDCGLFFPSQSAGQIQEHGTSKHEKVTTPNCSGIRRKLRYNGAQGRKFIFLEDLRFPARSYTYLYLTLPIFLIIRPPLHQDYTTA